MAYSFNVYDKFQLKLSSWRAGISVKLLLRLQLLLLRQTAPDQANGYSILVRCNVIPGRSFITIPIVIITLVLYETKKSMRINVGFEIRGWRPRTARGSHASRQGEPFLIRSRMDPIFFNILLSLYALRCFSLLFLIPVLPHNTHSLRLFRDRQTTLFFFLLSNLRIRRIRGIRNSFKNR